MPSLRQFAAFMMGAVALLLATGVEARAGFSVYLMSGDSTNTLSWTGDYDRGTGDKTISAHDLRVGQFRISGVFADSNSPGNPASADLNLTSLTIFNKGPSTATLWLQVVDTDFTQAGHPGSSMTLHSLATVEVKGGPGDGNSFTFLDEVDPNNGQFLDGSGNPTMSVTGAISSTTLSLEPVPGASGIFAAGNAVDYTRATTDYSLANLSSITLGPGGKVTLDVSSDLTDPPTAVPAPPALVLLLTGLPPLGLGACLRRRRLAI
jgi:hypothetical protein